jgi:YHS domain-containing protein
VLNIVFLIGFAGLLVLHHNRDRDTGARAHAVDPVCGMQVEKANAGASSRVGDDTVYFCSPRCQERFSNMLMRSAP